MNEFILNEKHAIKFNNGYVEKNSGIYYFYSSNKDLLYFQKIENNLSNEELISILNKQLILSNKPLDNNLSLNRIRVLRKHLEVITYNCGHNVKYLYNNKEVEDKGIYALVIFYDWLINYYHNLKYKALTLNIPFPNDLYSYIKISQLQMSEQILQKLEHNQRPWPKDILDTMKINNMTGEYYNIIYDVIDYEASKLNYYIDENDKIIKYLTK